MFEDPSGFVHVACMPCTQVELDGGKRNEVSYVDVEKAVPKLMAATDDAHFKVCRATVTQRVQGRLGLLPSTPWDRPTSACGWVGGGAQPA